MNENYLELLTKIKNTLEEINCLQENLHGLLDAPSITLENLERMRDTLEEIKGLQEDVEE